MIIKLLLLCLAGDNHLMARCKVYSSVKLINHASSFGLTGNFRNVPQSGLQSYLRMKSVNSASLCSQKEQLLQCTQHERTQEQLQPSCQPDYLLYNLSDQLQHQKKELHSQQQHLSSRNRILLSDQPQSILNGSRRAKGCAVQDQSYDQSDQPQLQRKEQYQQHLSMENRKSGGLPSQRILNGYKLVNNCVPNEVSLQGTVSSNATESMVSSPTINSMEHKQPPLKRTKTDDPFHSHKSQNDASKVSVPVEDSFNEGNTLECQEFSTSLNTTPESMDMDTGPSSSSSQDSHAECYAGKTVDPIMDIKMKLHPESSSLELTDARPEKENMQVPVEADKVIQVSNCMNNMPSDVHVTETKPRKLKKGVSLIDSFTPEKIREHISSLMPSVGQVSIFYESRVNCFY